MPAVKKRKPRKPRWTYLIPINYFMTTCEEVFGNKPKRKVAPYYVEYNNGSIALEDKCFETDEEARKYFGAKSVTRCTALEIEV